MSMHPFKIARFVLSTIATIFLISCASVSDDVKTVRPDIPRSVANDSSLALRLPQSKTISYSGLVSFDQAGVGTGSMLYPAPNAVVALAALAIHGAINEALKNSEKNELRTEADKVLLPYQAVLSNYSYQELMQRGLEMTATGGRKRLIGPTETPGGDWLIESAPVFFMTQDESALIIESSVSIYAPESPSAVVYQNVVRVVSRPKNAPDLASLWTSDEGRNLKEESARLFAHSLDIAFDDMANGSSRDNSPYKTFRYAEGRAEKMERGQLVSAESDRIVLKTLRGWLMSVPPHPGTTPK